MHPHWLVAALDPPRAYGVSLARGTLRATPEDFVVEEDLGFAASGTGQHVLLKVRKRDANTQWIARELAKLASCHPRDIGFAGIKDRHAVAVQWFTVPRSSFSLESWRAVREAEFDVLEAEAHSRKLPRGALAGNWFVIRVTNVVYAVAGSAEVTAGVADADGVDADVRASGGGGAAATAAFADPAAVNDTADGADALAAAPFARALAHRVADIGARGVPNYFGPQRFGRDASNLTRISDSAKALHPAERGFVLSAARSVVFNAVLAERVKDGTWDTLDVGDTANLDGRGSIFPVDTLDSTLTKRCAHLDIHPTGPMWGKGVPTTYGRAGELEARIAGEFPEPCALVVDAGMDQERRALRLAVRELTYGVEPDALTFRFRLTRGSFATTVLRELLEFDTVSGEDRGDS